MTHICVSRVTITGSDNGLSPGWRQAIIWTNAEILFIGPLRTNFSEILIKILTFSFTKMSLRVSSAKWQPFCLSLNVLMNYCALLYVCCQCWMMEAWWMCDGWMCWGCIWWMCYGCLMDVWWVCRADSRCAPSQWETALLCNDISHWQDASLESVLGVLWMCYGCVMGVLWMCNGCVLDG